MSVSVSVSLLLSVCRISSLLYNFCIFRQPVAVFVTMFICHWFFVLSKVTNEYDDDDDPLLPVLPQICTCYLLTYLLASIPLPVYNIVYFTSILFFYASDYSGLGVGPVGFGLGLTGLSWSRSHTPWSRPRSWSHCFMVSLISLFLTTMYGMHQSISATP